jgi:hypothetical protein
MALVDSLRALLGDERAASFQLMGEDLALVPAAQLVEAARAYERELDAIAPSLRPRFEAEQAAIQAEAHRWLRRYNRSVHTRLRGYLALGRRSAFEYPWPVVAMLGICQVLSGIGRNRVFGLLAPAVRRLGSRLLDELVESTEDVLRRTNRGIFADSVPTVLYALRVRELAAAGEGELARALTDGPLPPLMDGESRALIRGLAEGLAIADPGERFDRLAALTLTHFGREQAIFSFHLGGGRTRKPEPALVRRLLAVREVAAPRLERDRAGTPRVVFRPFRLPAGFDLRDHAARVELFGRAFVLPVTADRDGYRAAVRYVEERFG